MSRSFFWIGAALIQFSSRARIRFRISIVGENIAITLKTPNRGCAIGVALTDLNGRFLATNHVYQTIVGYTEEELRALCFLDVTHEDYREANWALITELLEGKRRQFQIEKKYRRKDGSSIWVSNNVSLVPGTERVPRFIMALSEDITQRKRAEEALQRSEGYLAEAQKLTHTGSWVWNVRTDALFW